MLSFHDCDPPRKIKERNLKLVLSGQLQPKLLHYFVSPICKFKHLYFLKNYYISSFLLLFIYFKELVRINIVIPIFCCSELFISLSCGFSLHYWRVFHINFVFFYLITTRVFYSLSTKVQFLCG